MVKYCSDTFCKLWPWRFGCRPGTLLKGKQKEGFKILFNGDNFQKGGICDPDIMADEIEKAHPELKSASLGRARGKSKAVKEKAEKSASDPSGAASEKKGMEFRTGA